MRGEKRSAAVLLAIVGSCVVIFTTIVHETRCRTRCSAAVREADKLAEADELRSALAAIDEVDAQCGCGSDVEGDEPEEYAAARTYVDRLVAGGQEGEARAIVANGRGPILREFAKAIGPKDVPDPRGASRDPRLSGAGP